MQQPGVISAVKKGACHCVAAAPDIPDHLLVRDLLFVSLHTLWDCVCLTLIIQPSDRLTRWFSDIRMQGDKIFLRYQILEFLKVNNQNNLDQSIYHQATLKNSSHPITKVE